MKYKIDTCRWELVYLHDTLSLFLQMVLGSKGRNDIAIAISHHLYKVNTKIFKKALKVQSTDNQEINLNLDYLDLSALKMVFERLEFEDNVFAIEIKNKILKLIQFYL